LPQKTSSILAELNTQSDQWNIVVTSKTKLFDLKLHELWAARELILLFVKRDLKPTYKQTILGPLWFVLQPLLTTLVYSLVFGRVARIPTDDLPQIIFYLPGIILWNFFNSSFLKNAGTLSANVGIFSKVYFPRLVVPVANIMGSGFNFLIQLGLFLCIFLFYLIKGSTLSPNYHILFVPLLLLILAGLSFGFGILVSSFTVRYRDLSHFLSFGLQLLMYATPIIYPISMITDSTSRRIIYLNPLTSVVEGFKYAFLGRGDWNWAGLGYSTAIMLVAIVIGLIQFNQAEKTSVDTV
jgi:lipopolysaccharide transport system permease protein